MSAIEDFQSTTFAALPHEDLTVGEAWASSPLGDPEIEDGSLSQPGEFDDSAATNVIAKPRSRGTSALLAGAVVAAFGAVAGLGLLLIDGSKDHKPAVVVPNSSVGSMTPAPSAVAPPPVAPAPPPAPTPPDALSPGPVGGGEAPVVIAPAPPRAPAPVAPPAAPPPPPNVTVNAPPVIVPVPVPIPVPPYQGGSQQGGGQPAPSGHPPIQCLACHPPQPVHPQPIHPQPPQHP